MSESAVIAGLLTGARRRLAAGLTAAVILAGGLVLAPAALAQLNSGALNTQASESTVSTQTVDAVQTSTASSGSVSKSIVITVIGAALLLLAAIAWFIAKDARSRVRKPGRPSVATSGEMPAQRVRRQRTKAKAARQQRKRNRNRNR